MRRRRRHAWVGFALFALLAFTGVFLLHGAAAGAVCLAAMLMFIAACTYVLRGEDHDDVGTNTRRQLTGWWWF
jgi:hypothetical protein